MIAGIESRSHSSASMAQPDRPHWQSDLSSAHNHTFQKMERNGDIARRSCARQVASRKTRAKENSLFGLLCAWIVEHQLGLSINMVLLLGLVHICFPRARRRTRKYFELSYRNPETGLYGRGQDDLEYVLFWVVVLTGLRALLMDYVLKPVAIWGGLKAKGAVRFAEQGWMVVYYSLSTSVGLYIIVRSNYWWNFRELWAGYPMLDITALSKWYYLTEFASWLQQIVTVNIEERRKDHWQMVSHHVITCGLILASYGTYQTNVGTLILVLMDSVDVALSVAKCLKYFGRTVACDWGFGIFMFLWMINRHVIYLMILHSIIRDLPAVMGSGCYSSTTGQLISEDGGTEILSNALQPFTRPGGAVCFNHNVRYTFIGLLSALQVITLIWFWMILRVAWKVINGQGADDTRSDVEDEEDQEEEIDLTQEPFLDDEKAFLIHANGGGLGGINGDMPPLEEEVGADALHFARRTSPRRQQFGKPSARASGISLAGHPDRKELLGRIGCEKPI